jgi:2-polyprenyl-3-methyl-5-hydroxy-6-metoxy-1,4-benzoquinol methylase
MASLDCCDRRMTTLQSLGFTQGRLLEIGCGTGRFLLVAKARQFGVWGIESDAAQRTEAESALGIPLANSLDSIEPACAPFDAVTLWGVLPTVDLPVAVLSWAADRMRPGALLGLSVGELASRALHRFTRQSIELGLLRAGFEQIEPAAERGLRNKLVAALRPKTGELEIWGRRR